jgi:hypothetical protein
MGIFLLSFYPPAGGQKSALMPKASLAGLLVRFLWANKENEPI